MSVVGFYTDRRGRKRPIKRSRGVRSRNYPPKKRSLFGPAKNQEAAKHIMIATPTQARDSIQWLNKEWEDSKTREHRVRLVKYANQAANRAEVTSNNPRVSYSQRAEAREVARIYRNWVQEHEGKE